MRALRVGLELELAELVGHGGRAVSISDEVDELGDLGVEFGQAARAFSDFRVLLAKEIAEFLGEALSRVSQAAIRDKTAAEFVEKAGADDAFADR